MKISKYYIHGANVFTEKSILKNAFVLIDDGIISDITFEPIAGIVLIDLGEFTLLPGFLDLHIHGREGADVMDATPEAIETISVSLAKYGVVGFLATTVTSTWQNTLAAFKNIGKSYQNQPSGAQVLGAYNEGLFFTEDHKGAHDEQYFLALTKENIDAIIDVSNGALKVVALAPELPNSDDIIRYLSSQGIKPMLGHTDANYQQTCEALHAGACGGVHVFNGMRGIHHRDPGCAGAVLIDKNAYVEVIADGVHLHPAILEMVYRMKGQSHMGLISDCIVAGGLSDGSYKLGMLDVEVNKGVARTLSGSLAGSTLTLNKAVNNLISLANIPAIEAVNMASLAPATFLGVEQSLGSIAINKRACLSIVDDNYNVQGTLVDGKLVFANEALLSLFTT